MLPTVRLTVREAAFVSGVSHEHIAKAFDEHAVESVASAPRRRELDVVRTVIIAVREALKSYPAHLKEAAQQAVQRTLREARSLADIADVEVADDFVVTRVRLRELARTVQDRIDRLRRLRELIVVARADGRTGAPVFRGTRVPVRQVAVLVREGADRRAVLTAFPGLTEEMVEMALLYDELHPRRGRPSRGGPAE